MMLHVWYFMMHHSARCTACSHCSHGNHRPIAPCPMPADNCIAFGDGTNDIEMLTWAGVGVSMGNAETEAVTAGAVLRAAP